MSETRARLTADMKETMKLGQKDRLSVIRMLLAEIKNAEINDLSQPGRERTEGEVIAILSAYRKSLQKNMAEFPPERQAPLKAELAIVDGYLPQALSAEEIKALVESELSQVTERNFGALMKHMQGKLGARAEGKVLADVLKSTLSAAQK